MRWLALSLVALLCACGRSDSGAPVVHADRSGKSASARLVATGQEVIVRNGDTLHRIAKEQGVELKALIDANRLTAPYRIYPGQRLAMPRGGVARQAVRVAEPVAVTVSRSPYGSSDGAAQASPSGYGATGGPPQVARLGEPVTVTVSRSAYDPTAPAADPSLASAAAAKIEAHPLGPAPVFPERPRVQLIPPSASVPVESPAVMAAQAPLEPDATSDRVALAFAPRALPPDLGPPPPRTSQRFLWPVRGEVIVAFGPRNGGLHNDGINIRAARGATVRAAENGVVAYVGNELRGFGNLLLIKHADGWMSAYAHNDVLLVKTGDRVRRGQPISRVGSTGNVAHPQLHFELRRGSRAVDPLRYLGEGEA